MTAKSEAFKDALEALCVEHGMRLSGRRDYDDYSVYLEEATEKQPAGCEIARREAMPPTPAEQAELDRIEEADAACKKASIARYEEQARQRAEWMPSSESAAIYAENPLQAILSGEQCMRVYRTAADA